MALAVALALGCAGADDRASLGAALTAVDPACVSDASATPITIHGTLPVKPQVSLAGGNESTLDVSYRAWVGETELADVAWVDATTLTATVPAGLAAGVYAIGVQSPFGDTSLLDGFRVASGACSTAPPGPAKLATEANAAPEVIASGDLVILTIVVRNVGETGATGVTVAVSPPAGFTPLTTETDPRDIAPASSRTYTWTYTAQPPGGMFTIGASGADAASAQRVSAPPVNTNEVTVASGGVHTYAVGGTIDGLAGSGLSLRLNGVEQLTVPAGATSFAFRSALQSGASYAVTVAAQPASPAQTCTVASGAGTVGTANVTSVRVSCTTSQFTVGGSVSGLVGAGLALQLNGGPELAVASAGTFTFPPVPSGTRYAVTVARQPADPVQACTVANGTGTVGDADVSSVRVTCSTPTFSVGGSVSGLNDGNKVGLELSYGSGATSSLTVNANGSFTFGAAVPSGAAYAVRVRSQPKRQTCVVTQGTGTVGAADIADVAVTCRKG